MSSGVESVLVFLSIHFFIQSAAMWNLQGKPGGGYYLEVLIGTPPQKFSVLVDTGSTNLAIAATMNSNTGNYFDTSNSSSFHPLNQAVSVVYTQGFWKGHLGSDVVWFPSVDAPNVTCDISLIESSQNFYMKESHWQGILGLAYPMIAQPNQHMLSWLEALHAKNSYFSKSFSLELCGSNTEADSHVGSFQILGEKDNFVSPFSTPIVREWFYEITLLGIHIGNETVALPCEEFNNDKTIIDSGTTSFRLPSKVFQELVGIIDGVMGTRGLSVPQEFWNRSRMMCGDLYSNMTHFPRIKLSIAHSPSAYFMIELPSESYIRKVYDTSENMGRDNCYKLAVESSDAGTVLGVTVMEGLVVMFNQSNRTVTFKESECGPPVKLLGPFEKEIDLSKCNIILDDEKAVTSLTGAYAIGIVLGVCGLAELYCIGLWLWEKFYFRRRKDSGSQENLVTAS